MAIAFFILCILAVNAATAFSSKSGGELKGPGDAEWIRSIDDRFLQLETCNKKQEVDIRRMKNEIEVLKGTVEAQQLEIGQLRNGNSGRRETRAGAYPGTAVGFSAVLSTPMEHTGINQNIVFDQVITNVGNAYNYHQGIFVAPVHGLYVFSFTIAGMHANNHINLDVNGQKASYIFVRALESPYNTASQTVVLQLSQGDDVTVKTVDSDDYIHAYSTIFSGFLLQESGSGGLIGK